MTQLERLEKRLEKLEKIAAANSVILHNGIGDKVGGCERAIKAIEEKMIELALLIASFSPKPEMPFWKKQVVRWVGMFVIIGSFIGLAWLAFTILPHDTVDRVIDAAIRSQG